MSSRDAQQADWLRSVLEDKNAEKPAPIYAWNAANIGLKASTTDNAPARLPDGSDPERRRIFILGVGNLGRLFASSLAKLHNPNPPPITLVVHRRELLERWHANPGIEITRDGRVERSCVDANVEWWTEEKPVSGPLCEPGAGHGISNLIVATKAEDALPQADRLRGYLTSKSTVAFTQNGMCPMWPPQGADYSAHRWPRGDGPNWIACITTHGVTSSGPFQSVHASQAWCSVGPVLLNGQQSGGEFPAAYLINQLALAPHLDGKAVSRGDLWILQLEKLIINCVINPLTATLGCKNGGLFPPHADETLSRVIDSLIREASSVLQALVSDERISSEILEGRIMDQEYMKRLLERFSFGGLRAMVLDVGVKVRDNTSSMLQDVRAGKTTEIRAFNGWLVETAALLDPNLRLPTHERLISMVEAGITLKHDEIGCLLASTT
ncbi:6-phosphogluconate dehydrogenase C-terminal domain-like protein [Apiospora aurea]|uniref:6-phosphogluconate dehydrogenase C-terminal domain-like protein n=1 Tax=Apiospora aurea TaxID=335848 RepID=A0ABR1PRN4_9PEZI